MHLDAARTLNRKDPPVQTLKTEVNPQASIFGAVQEPEGCQLCVFTTGCLYWTWSFLKSNVTYMVKELPQVCSQAPNSAKALSLSVNQV